MSQRSPLLLASALLLLSACQAPNPYLGSTVPVPPAPTQASAAIDRSAYPAPAPDFARYRSWRWQQLPSANQWASSADIQLAVSNALDQRGLRPQQNDAPSDLTVSVRLFQEQRLRQVYDHYDSAYAWGHGYYGHGYSAWGGPRWGSLRSYTEPVLVVQLELYDGHAGQLLWSTRASVLARTEQHSQALHQALQQALSDYPPAN